MVRLLGGPWLTDRGERSLLGRGERSLDDAGERVLLRPIRVGLAPVATASRRALTVLSAVLVVAALVQAIIGLASRVPTVVILGSSVGSSPTRADSEPLLGAAGALAPLETEYLARVLGKDLSAFLGPAVRDPVAEPDGGRGRLLRLGDRPGPGPSSTTTTTTTALLGPLESPLPQFSDLAVSMGADRSTVPAGDHIVYTITVANVGTADFRGELRLESHHPFWTTDSSTPCGETGVDPDPDHPCVNPPAPVPGTPDEDLHSVQFSYGGSIPEGSMFVHEFRVRVNPGTPPGTQIRNHAHLDVLGDGQGPVTSNATTVTVR